MVWSVYITFRCHKCTVLVPQKIRKGKTTQVVIDHSSHQIRIRSHVRTGYCKTPPSKIKENIAPGIEHGA